MKIGILHTLRLKNFKAVRDSGVVTFTPLTAFIGNNGSGKSSVVEGLETLREITQEDLDFATEQWRGFENIWYQGVEHEVPRKRRRTAKKPPAEQRASLSEQMSFSFSGRYRYGEYGAVLEVASGPGGDELFIAAEKVTVGQELEVSRDSQGRVRFKGSVPLEFGHIRVEGEFEPTGTLRIDDGRSVIGETPYLQPLTSDWQFISMVPQQMGWPVFQRRAGGAVRLEKDGSNVAEYLLSIRRRDQDAFDGIIDTARYILGYARDIQPALSSELERSVYLSLSEANFKVPGWMLSTGTIRVLALLALLRHPEPPPLIVIEEVENGLDPRTLHVVVDEIRSAVESGRTQVIVTTHSPYFLDLLDLSQIVLVERVEGHPKFTRPDRKLLKDWSKRFSPGRLYTMGKMSGGR